MSALFVGTPLEGRGWFVDPDRLLRLSGYRTKKPSSSHLTRMTNKAVIPAKAGIQNR